MKLGYLGIAVVVLAALIVLLMLSSGHSNYVPSPAAPAVVEKPSVLAPVPEAAAHPAPPTQAKSATAAPARGRARGAPAAARGTGRGTQETDFAPDSWQRLSTRVRDQALNPIVLPPRTSHPAAVESGPTYVKVSRPFAGAKGIIGAVHFMPDGKSLVSAGADDVMRVWDLATGRVTKFFAAAGGAACCMDISADGKKIAIGRVGGDVTLYTPAGRLLINFRAQAIKVQQVRFLPEGNQLLSSGCDGVVNLWDAANGKKIFSLQAHDSCAEALDVNVKGTLALSGSPDKSAKIIDLVAGQIVSSLPGIDQEVHTALWGPGNQALVFMESHLLGFDALASKQVFDKETSQTRTFHSAVNADHTIGAATHFEQISIFSTGDGRLLGELSGTRYSYQTVAISPDGKTVAAAASRWSIEDPHGADEFDPFIYVWDLEKTEIFQKKGAAGTITQFAASSDGKHVATGWSDGSVQIVEAATNKKGAELHGNNGPVAGLTFEPGGQRLASCDDRELDLWDIGAGSKEGHWALPAPAVGLTWLPNGKLIAGVGKDVMVWTTDGAGKTLGTGERNVELVAAAPDGHYAAITFEGGTGGVYDVSGDTPPRPIHTPNVTDIRLIAALPDNQHFVTIDGLYGMVEWSFATLGARQLRDPQMPRNPRIWAGTADSVLATGTNGSNQSLQLLNLTDGHTLVRINAPSGSIFGARYIAGSDEVLMCTVGGAVSAQPVGLPRGLPRGMRYSTLATSADGKLAATVTSRRNLYLWDTASGDKKADVPEVVPPNSTLWSAALSADGDQAAVASNLGVNVVDVKSGTVTHRLQGPKGAFGIVVFSPDAQLLASAQGKLMDAGGQDYSNTVYLWEVATGKELRRLEDLGEKIHGLAWSPDGKQLLTLTGGNVTEQSTGSYPVCVWEAATGKLLHTFPMFARRFADMAYTNDGRKIVLVDFELGAQVYDARTFELLQLVALGGGTYSKLCMSPDGKNVLFLRGRGQLSLYDLDQNRLTGHWGSQSAAYAITPFFAGNQPAVWWAEDQDGAYYKVAAAQGGGEPDNRRGGE